MSEPTDKQLSRRDALKLLGAAAGASVLANLPSKWSTPQLTAGVLPAHAQSSPCEDYVLTYGASFDPGPGPDYPQVEAGGANPGGGGWAATCSTGCLPKVFPCVGEPFEVEFQWINANGDYVFNYWLVDGANAGSNKTITVTMNMDHSVFAVFDVDD